MIRRAAYQAVNISLISPRDNLLQRRYREITAKQGDTKDVRQKAKVKLCAKLVRIVFAVLSKKEPYQEALMDQ